MDRRRRAPRTAPEPTDLRIILAGYAIALVGVAVFASINSARLATAERTADIYCAAAHEASVTAEIAQGEADGLRQELLEANATLKAVDEDREAALTELAIAKRRIRTLEADDWHAAKVSWYGPRFYGNGMAGGGTLTKMSMVCAVPREKLDELPFGTRITFRYKGRTATATVKDTGAFAALGRAFDLGPGTAKALGFSGVGTVEWRVER